MNKRSRLPLALALALGSSSAFALGLGQIEVKSALNQPLAAEIPVLSTLSGEADALVVRLAPPEALARVGLPEPSGVAANLQFAVDTNDAGQTIIRVSTPGSVNDPFVTFLLEVDWGKGKMLREYTVLLDPPTMASVRRAPVAAPAEVEPAVTEPLADAPPPPEMVETAPEPAPEPIAEAPVASAPEPEPEPVAEAPAPSEPVAEAEPTPEPEPAPAEIPPAPGAARVDTYGPVSDGETLWSIAQFARPDASVSMNQMMLALLYANPDAFIDQNINRLKKGAILRIPNRDEAMATAAADAALQVREQMQSWRDSQPVMQPAEPRIADAPATSSPTARPASTDSRLELVPPSGDTSAESAQSGATAAGEGRELRAELARRQEEMNTLSQENVELKSRVGELEKIREDSERLISLKDSELAAAQQRLAELQAQRESDAATAAAAAAAGTAPEATPDESVDATTAPAIDATAEAPADATADVVLPADPTDAATTDTSAADGTVTQTTPASADTPATSITSSPVEDTPPVASPPTPPPPAPAPPAWYMSPYVLGGVALVVVGLLALMLGRRRRTPAATPAPRYSASTSAVASSVAATQAKAAARAEPPKPAVVEVEQDDPGAELAEAVARDPGNLNRHLELVRYYYDAGDAAGFEHAAEAMYARVYDPNNLVWKQVLAMGREIAPEHPLFLEPEAPVPPPAAVVVPAAAVVPAVAVPAAPAAPAPREIDWGSPARPAADSGATQQMRIDDVRNAGAMPEPAMIDIPDIEQDFDNFTTEPVLEPADAGGGDEGFLDADASSTKLELARAYLDMGDVEGARGMLEEVVSEGNPGQRAEAKRLLDEIR